MAKINLGFSREVDITFTDTSKGKAKKVVNFLKKHGIEEVGRRDTSFLLSIEFDADGMYPSWEQLRGALKEEFPEFKYQYSEGIEDDDPDYYKEYESLAIYD